MRPLWQGPCEVLIPPRDHGCLGSSIVKTQAKETTHHSQGLLRRMHALPRLCSVPDVCREIRQDRESRRGIEVIGHGLQEGLPPRAGVQRSWRVRPRLHGDGGMQHGSELRRVCQCRGIMLPDMPIVVPRQVKAYGIRSVLLQEILDHEEIAQ